MNVKYLSFRKKINEIHKIDISNKEWLYMLGEETRHSVAIEGIFSKENELKKVIENNSEEDVKIEIINYFRAAQFIYDFALQFRDQKEIPPYMQIIKTLHSQLFKNTRPNFKVGELRKNSIEITNARITPPFNPEDWMDFFYKYIPFAILNYPIYKSVSRIHTLFESIHPFNDGNGRIGRLLMNFILISNGYCNIAIKGIKKEDRDKYYNALEKADTGIDKLFKIDENVTLEKKAEIIDEGDFSQIEEIIFQSMIESMNKCIIISTNKEEHLTVKETAAKLNISETAVKKRIEKGSLIAAKNKKGMWEIYPYNLKKPK